MLVQGNEVLEIRSVGSHLSTERRDRFLILRSRVHSGALRELMSPQGLYIEFVCTYVSGGVHLSIHDVAKAVIYTRHLIFNMD